MLFSKKIILIFLGLVIVVAGFVYFLAYQEKPVLADVADNVDGFAWASNIGWISFNCDNAELPNPRCKVGPASNINNYGVNINDVNPNLGYFFGYAWARGTNNDVGGVGWLSFEAPDVVGCPGGGNCRARIDFTSCGIAPNPAGVCDIIGWARFKTAMNEPATAGGWDGWVSLNCKNTGACGASDYGLVYDNSGASPVIKGFAWSGGGTSASNAVVGWISFTARNFDDDPHDGIIDPQPPGPINPGEPEWPNPGDDIPDYGIIPPDISVPGFNDSPNQPATLLTDQYHCWEFSPQVADGLSLRLSWIYSDPDGDDQSSFEVQVDTNNLFNTSRFDHIVLGSASALNNTRYYYSLDLAQDDGLVVDGANDPDNNVVNDWLLSDLNWNTTYYWRVRVKDVGSNTWSVWSNALAFTTPLHAYPNVSFNWNPLLPAKDEIIQLNNNSQCYNAGGVSVPCAGAPPFSWTLPADGSFVLPSNASSENPQVKFTSRGFKAVNLEVSDGLYTCDKSINLLVGWSIPGWREIAP